METSQPPVILAAGSINADFQVRVARPLSHGGTFAAQDFRRLSGGKAANIALLARRFGLASRLFGCTGDDDLREQALAPLQAAGVDLRGVTALGGCDTAVSMIAVGPDGGETVVLAGNANQAWPEVAMLGLEQAIHSAAEGSVVVIDYEITPAAVLRAAHAARQRDLKLVLDPAPPDAVDRAIFPLTFAITPNPSEAASLTGITVEDAASAAAAARELAGRGVTAACVKLPRGGCVTAYQGVLTHIPPVPMPVVDRTGAGDAFAGALAVGILEGRPPVEAACFAVAASHIAVSRYGSQDGYPGRQEAEQLLPALRRNAQALAG